MADRLQYAGYRAFISYSHRDRREARWLHRRLEAYRIPKRLVGTVGKRGSVPARLAPIFRDRDELPASESLSETVRSALDASDALLVLCSPAAAASQWVGREIATFRQLHPDRPIFAAIISGEPGPCFPPELLRAAAQPAVEPAAADLRRQGDGRRLGVLKLVAGLAGLGLDELVQRDSQRRLRRVMAITVAALVGMLAMGLMTISAIAARAEAERQRVEAEGLVEFMLTDLRDNLRKVGRLDAMSAVNERALRYYGQSRLADLPDESRIRQARILQAIGDDYLVADRPDKALAAFQQARATTQAQVDGGPVTSGHLLAHSKSLMGLGRAHEEMRAWPQARAYYVEAAAVADRLVEQEPANPDHLMKAAAAAINLGNVQFYGLEDPRTAEQSYQRALGVLARALRLRPGDEHILLSQANAYAYLADSYYGRSLWTVACQARLRQHAIIAPLAHASPDNLDVVFRLAAARRGLALSLRECGQADAARTRLQQARDATQLLVRRDPGNHDWLALKKRLEQDWAGLDRSRN